MMVDADRAVAPNLRGAHERDLCRRARLVTTGPVTVS
jgi:hypothetical protein